VFQEILERRAAELVQVLRKARRPRNREERGPNGLRFSMRRNEILAMRNGGPRVHLLRQVKAALASRIHDGSFGVCIECEFAISPKRLAACHGRRVVSSARTAAADAGIGRKERNP